MDQNVLQSWFQGIKGRLLIAAVLPVFGFVAIFFISYRSLQTENQIINTAYSQMIPKTETLGALRLARNKFGLQVWAAASSIANADHVAMNDHFKKIQGAIEDFNSAFADYSQTTFLPEEKTSFDSSKSSFVAAAKTMAQILTLLQTQDPAKVKEAQSLLAGDFERFGNDIAAHNGTTTKLYKELAKSQSQEAQSTQSYAFNMLMVLTLFSSLCIFVVLLWIATRVSTSVSNIAFHLSTSSTQVVTAVNQLSKAGNGLSDSATKSAASLEETVAALEELTSMVSRNSENAREAAALSSSSRTSAETGEHDIQNLIHAITDISHSSKKIEEITSVIDDIAFQTNLLALNAAVEAARAGEQGKGFAVVAEAVRALAQRSASSAKDISSLIQDSVTKIENGRTMADKSGTVLTHIVGSIKKMSELNTEIASACSEQTAGIQQISKAMNQMDQVSQTNAASAEEIAATSGDILNLVKTTQGLTVELNQVILGSTQQNTPAAAAPRPTEDKKPQVVKKFTAKPSKPAQPASEKAQAVAPVAKSPPAPVKKKVANELIPFDEDDERSQIGDASGF